MNKFDLQHKVLMSDLKAEDKCLLLQLILLADKDGKSWPSVERLCKVRGIKHEKNFKGADHYLPGLVTKEKRGRKNIYIINTPAVAGLLDAEVVIKHTDTPAVEGVYTPAVEGVSTTDTPAVADNTPAVAGANSTTNTTSKNDSTKDTAPAAPVVPFFPLGVELDSSLSNQREAWLAYNFSLLEELANSPCPKGDPAPVEEVVLVADAPTDTPPDPASPIEDTADDWKRRYEEAQAKRAREQEERDARIAESFGYDTAASW